MGTRARARSRRSRARASCRRILPILAEISLVLLYVLWRAGGGGVCSVYYNQVTPLQFQSHIYPLFQTHTPSTHPLITYQPALWYIEKFSSKSLPQLLYPPIKSSQPTLSTHTINPPSHHLSISTVVYLPQLLYLPINTYQPTLSTHPINLPYQLTQSTPHYQPTLSSPLNKHCGISRSVHRKPPHSYFILLSTSIKLPSQSTPSTHPLITFQSALWYIEKFSSKNLPQLLYLLLPLSSSTMSRCREIYVKDRHSECR